MTVRYTAVLIAVLSNTVSIAWAADTASHMKGAATKIAVEVCAACHRAQGSTTPLVPTLMGQQNSYLAWQLRAYKLHLRDDPQAHDHMWSPVVKLDDSLIDALAEYYASQPPMASTPGDPALVARGKELYEKGIPSLNITACAFCHNEDGAGNGIFPRLAGQRADYLLREMALIQEHLRDVGIMHSTVKGLIQDDMRALAIFLQSK